jgi:hypothetical protein
MPHVDRVAREYAGRNVAFYSVNLGDPSEVVRQFIEKIRIDMTVLVDPTQRVGQQYGAPPIPLLVVIDKNGVVRSVYEGFNPALDRVLRQRLDTMLGLPPTNAGTAESPSGADAAQATPAKDKSL